MIAVGSVFMNTVVYTKSIERKIIYIDSLETPSLG